MKTLTFIISLNYNLGHNFNTFSVLTFLIINYRYMSNLEFQKVDINVDKKLTIVDTKIVKK